MVQIIKNLSPVSVKVVFFVHCTKMFPCISFRRHNGDITIRRIIIPKLRSQLLIMKQNSFFIQPVSDEYLRLGTDLISQLHRELKSFRMFFILLKRSIVPIKKIGILVRQIGEYELAVS